MRHHIAGLLTTLLFLFQHPPPGRMVDVGGRRLHLRCTGTSGPTVVAVGGSFSPEWDLVQSNVSRFAQFCSFDAAGFAWSDPSDQPQNCRDRVQDLANVLQAANIPGPYVLAGFSLGAMEARLYAHLYASRVRSLVLIDHAFSSQARDALRPDPVSNSTDRKPQLMYAPPIQLSASDDVNFAKLTAEEQGQLRWAESMPHPTLGQADIDSCQAELDQFQDSGISAKALLVVSTTNEQPGYRELQQRLLKLSRHSEQIIADGSSHLVLLDRPDVIVSAIKRAE